MLLEFLDSGVSRCPSVSFSGETFYPGVDTLVHGGSGKVSREGVDRMVNDLEKQYVCVCVGACVCVCVCVCAPQCLAVVLNIVRI